jgi:hypothetical protein
MSVMANPGHAFFNDIEDAAQVEHWVNKLEPAYYQYATPCITSDDWRSGPVTVIGAGRDNAIPVERQKMVWQGFEIEWLDLGHSPYVGHPERVADVLVKAVA